MSEGAAPVAPGATIGIMGGGQLGRMLALAARALGYRTAVYAPESDPPAATTADLHVQAPYDDLSELRRFASLCDVVTIEFENIPAAALAAVAALVPARPSVSVLEIAQDRLAEKSFLKKCAVPVLPFHAVRQPGDIVEGLKAVGTPAVIKTALSGYDGKGQIVIRTQQEAEEAFAALGKTVCVVERLCDLSLEFSVIGARGLLPQSRTGSRQVAIYGPIDNKHDRHILDTSTVPSLLPDGAQAKATEITRLLMESLDIVGLLCVEFFLEASGEIYVNELAPRPHNSGHLTIEASPTSQFEQVVRAVTGMGLGATEPTRPAAMANLLGDIWDSGEPLWERALADEHIHLHLYGKSAPRPGRKMGHLTALGPSAAQSEQIARAARQSLTRRKDP